MPCHGATGQKLVPEPVCVPVSFCDSLTQTRCNGLCFRGRCVENIKEKKGVIFFTPATNHQSHFFLTAKCAAVSHMSSAVIFTYGAPRLLPLPGCSRSICLLPQRSDWFAASLKARSLPCLFFTVPLRCPSPHFLPHHLSKMNSVRHLHST